MQTQPRPSPIALRFKLTLAQVAVVLAAVVAAEGIALLARLAAARWIAELLGLVSQPLGRAPHPLEWSLHLLLVAAAAGLMGLLLGLWTSRSLARRVGHALEVSRAWTRGNLAVRVVDPSGDEVGLLARQLNLLAERLEKDEEDLEELREHNMRLTDQVRALAVVEERNRLARELHDSVKQNLFSLAMTAGAIRARFDALERAPADLKEMILEIETTAHAAQQEMTRLIEDLRPESLASRGLASALNDYALLFGAREHILVYVEAQGNDAILPPAVSEALYRVAQEALHNVARHARATRVDVRLRCIPEQVSLTIEDNGVGFDANETHGGLGLANMQERVMDVGGVLKVESQPGAGTTVLAEIALPHPLGTQPESADLEGRPIPTIENWAWLGQRLTIPVGQTWPWLPADQVHLRHPLVDTVNGTPLTIRHSAGPLGLWRDYVIELGHRPLVRVHCGRSGYQWESQGASWALRTMRGARGRMVLTRNGQPVAAMQQQGRMLYTWDEIVYDGRGYRLDCVKGRPAGYILEDEANDKLLTAAGSDPDQAMLHRPLPLPLVVMALVRIAEEVVIEKEKVEREALDNR